jgi:hypothetical protein
MRLCTNISLRSDVTLVDFGTNRIGAFGNMHDFVLFSTVHAYFYFIQGNFYKNLRI